MDEGVSLLVGIWQVEVTVRSQKRCSVLEEGLSACSCFCKAVDHSGNDCVFVCAHINISQTSPSSCLTTFKRLRLHQRDASVFGRGKCNHQRPLLLVVAVLCLVLFWWSVSKAEVVVDGKCENERLRWEWGISYTAGGASTTGASTGAGAGGAGAGSHGCGNGRRFLRESDVGLLSGNVRLLIWFACSEE